MDVLFSTHPFAMDVPGGGEMQLLKYAEFLPQSGHAVRLLDIWKPGFREADVFHHFSLISGALPLLDYVKRLGVPIVLSTNLWINRENEAWIDYRELGHMFQIADVLVANGPSEVEMLHRYFRIPGGKAVSVPNGVDDYFFEPVDPALFRDRFGVREPFVLHVGNIERRKNQLVLLEALERSGLLLVCVGHVRDPAYLEACRSRHGKRFLHVGPIAHEDPLLRSAFAACDVFAFPSTLETPGIAALEAAACGARVVITREGSTRDYFADFVAYVDPFDVNSVRDGIESSLRRPVDARLKEHVQRNYTWANCVAQVADVYVRVVEKGAARSRKVAGA